MIWKDEIKVIEELIKKITNFGSDISRQLAHLESRRDTVANELVRLDADYQVILSRNDEAKKAFARAHKDELEQIEEAKRRVRDREVQLIEKEKEIRKLRAELETEIASAKATKNTMEAIGRNHVRK